MVKGDASLRIVENEQAHDCDLVVPGMHGQSASASLLLGSVTTQVLAEGTRDVLVSTGRWRRPSQPACKAGPAPADLERKGITVGPTGLGLVTAHDQIDRLAQVGVAVLLFAVGLKLAPSHVRHIGPMALATGPGQLALAILIGFALVLALGKGWMEALYVAVTLAFSSTISIVKLLSDKRELDSLHGRIAVGFLIVQDLAVIIAMMAVSALRGTGGTGGGGGGGRGGGRAGRVGRVQQRGRCLPGRLLARLDTLPGGDERAAGRHPRLPRAVLLHRPGCQAGALGAEAVPAIVLSLFVLIGNPPIVMSIMGFMCYRRRTGFMAGLTVAQISEFSIVFVAMGITLGHVGVQTLSLTTLVGLVTITVSTYMILYAQPLYARLATWLRIFERRRPFREIAAEGGADRERGAQAIVVGLGRCGSRLFEQLSAVRYDGTIVAAARDAGRARALAEAGVKRVLSSFDDAADHAAARLAHDIGAWNRAA